FAAALFRRATAGVRALLHGDANCTGAAPPHPQRSALPLLSRRSARGLAAARRRHDQARRRPELARRGTAAALHPRQHVSYRAADGAAPLVPWREHRVAGGGARRRRDRQCGRTGGEVSVNCRRPARHRGIRPSFALGRSRRAPFCRVFASAGGGWWGGGGRGEGPPQPSLSAGPVDQLTTPITASAPPTSR